PQLTVSISVFANLNDSYGYRFADWAGWNREGIIDIAMPMNFSTNNNNIFFPRADEALKNQGNRYVCIGQGAYTNLMENSLTQLKYVREKGFLGSVFYSYRQPGSDNAGQEQVFAFLKEHFQPTWIRMRVLP